ncbi:D-3-phosphoglycerate dehydrogenase [Caloramator quimbayensis]|uniref:2-oxoglutarate reductase n=1 Tax=Caloramator quimbayensis TaxID=1147123 RepID=A0A1T4WE29_9CLOT|nr:D-2-hydroxyacid dehydrogenase [Caloramator quimbayensis]SKA75586.1 D-3-phosphoglycerate dehydrogenase [Caloramator quimbayensis]
MIRVLISDGLDDIAVKILSDKGYDVLECEKEELLDIIRNVDVLVVRSATKVRKPLIDKALESKRLKLIIRGGVGVDNIDVEYAKESGIEVRNTPTASSISVAELTLSHMFAVSRFLHISNVTMRDNKWEKKKYEGVELFGKTLGLIGFGRIAREVAKRAYSLGMDVIYYDILGKADGYDEYEYCSFDDVLKKSDYVSLHIPYSNDKRNVIGERELSLMKDTAFLINCARGGVVDENALLDALNNNKIAGAGIDVFEEEPTKNEQLINHPKVSVTPHIGASTVEAQKRIGLEVVDIIDDFFNRKGLF